MSAKIYSVLLAPDDCSLADFRDQLKHHLKKHPECLEEIIVIVRALKPSFQPHFDGALSSTEIVSRLHSINEKVGKLRSELIPLLEDLDLRLVLEQASCSLIANEDDALARFYSGDYSNGEFPRVLVDVFSSLNKLSAVLTIAQQMRRADRSTQPSARRTIACFLVSILRRHKVPVSLSINGLYLDVLRITIGYLEGAQPEDDLRRLAARAVKSKFSKLAPKISALRKV